MDTTNLTNKEKAENAIKWIDALPNYSQGYGLLRLINEEGDRQYCCLGVGCELFNIEHHDDAEFSQKFAIMVGLYDYTGKFSAPSGQNVEIEGRRSLVGLNDSGTNSFVGIQKVLKQHPQSIFIPEVAKLIIEHYQNT